MPREPVIAPSILAADFGRLGDDVTAVDAAGADWIHVDVMDGHFVPNITFGPDLVRAIRPRSKLLFDVHLMIAPADPFLAAFQAAGADRLTVHAEAGPHLHRTLQVIRGLGCRAGVAINPGTPVEAVHPVLDMVDLVLVMTVNPGFGGQAFLPSMLDKIAAVRALLGERPTHVEVDGGITPETIGKAAEAGANAFVAGSAVFADRQGDTPFQEAITSLRLAAR